MNLGKKKVMVIPISSTTRYDATLLPIYVNNPISYSNENADGSSPIELLPCDAN
jgi:hypothetical protein